MTLTIDTIAGARRYHEWRDRLGIANSVLTARLKRLPSAGLFEQVAYQERPVRHEYVLTPRGRSACRILLVIWAWERGATWWSSRLCGGASRRYSCFEAGQAGTEGALGSPVRSTAVQ